MSRFAFFALFFPLMIVCSASAQLLEQPKEIYIRDVKLWIGMDSKIATNALKRSPNNLSLEPSLGSKEEKYAIVDEHSRDGTLGFISFSSGKVSEVLKIWYHGNERSSDFVDKLYTLLDSRANGRQSLIVSTKETKDSKGKIESIRINFHIEDREIVIFRAGGKGSGGIWIQLSEQIKE